MNDSNSLSDSLSDVLGRISFSKNSDLRLTPEQKHRLIALSFSENNPFFDYRIKNGLPDKSDVSFLYDFLSMRIDKEHTIDEIIQEIEKIIEFYGKVVSHHTLLFKTGNFFHEEEAAVQADLKRIKGDMNFLGPGFIKCPVCKSDRTVSIGVQVRGGDEGMDSFNECMACSHKWRIRG